MNVLVMDAHHLDFDEKFDVIICLQNGLSALKGEAARLISGAVSLLTPGGRAYFSTYSPNFWAYRLAWFQEQADKGLLGELDFAETTFGTIVCKDGFNGVTFNEEELIELGRASGCLYEVREVDKSSLFLTLERVEEN